MCLFVCCFVLFKVSKHSISRDLEAPSVNTGMILFLVPAGECKSRRWVGLPAPALLSLSTTAATHLRAALPREGHLPPPLCRTQPHTPDGILGLQHEV